MTNIATSAVSKDKVKAGPVKVAFSSLIGTTIEWYDYYIFGVAAALIFSTHFFPNLNPVAGTLASMSTLAVAFIARPFGGIIFGHFGDRIGRKTMLVYSIGLMGAATFVMGLLPTYDQIGIWAAVTLVLLRFCQGLAVGGEWGGAVLMALEHAPKNKRAFFASFPQCGVPFGLVLSSGAFYFVQLLPRDDFEIWGWRIPFLASIFLVLIGLYVRNKVSESPEFERVESRGEKSELPIASVMKTAKRSVVVGVFSVAASNAIFWLATVYLLNYGVSHGIERGTFFLALIIGGALEVFTIPFVAMFADKYGRKTVMTIGALAVAAIAFPLFALVNSGQEWAVFLAIILALPVAHALSYSVVSSFVAELFEPKVRYTGSAIAYQIGGVVTSAPIPVIATYLYDRTGSTHAISFMLIFAAVLTICAVIAARFPSQDVK